MPVSNAQPVIVLGTVAADAVSSSINNLFSAQVCLYVFFDRVIQVGFNTYVLTCFIEYRHYIFVDADTMMDIRPFHDLCLQTLDVIHFSQR